ncbi:MAG: acetate--CoA ligase [Planctomycetes bacterium]|nr:acetate--CoA ligase [Planctomycetota bacterium]
MKRPSRKNAAAPKPPSENITSVLKEKRVFKPSAQFSKAAHVKSLAQYKRLHTESIKSPDKFWGRVAGDLRWAKKWKKVLTWKEPDARWFEGGKLNVSDNCLDRHCETWRKNKAAIIWEGEPGDARTLTYGDLLRQTMRFANVLKSLGVKAGDRVIIYMPLIPEAAVAMLACTRIGAPHSVVFGGFSAESLKDRINDCGAKVVVTADGGYRRGAVVALKPQIDLALQSTPTVEKVVVVRRAANEISMEPGRDIWFHEAMQSVGADCPPTPLDAEHPLFILYTSGSTGKPKGVLHTTGGYLVQTQLSTRLVFDLREEDTYWCTADIGWVTGHSYVLYGPLCNGATTVMYEGAPNFPEPDRLWRIIEKHRVSVFYTAPTAIRAFMKWGDHFPMRCDLSSLRLLGTVGEPINPEAWMWYRELIGHGRCPIVDTWWQTETGSILITPLPGATPTKPGTATLPFFGVVADVVDRAGNSQPDNVGGFLVIRRPWPSMLRSIWGDPDRYRRTYWSDVKGCYFTGDGARRDKDGYFWIVGRIDDVLNVAGHRIGTAEVESALVSHQKVAEAAVVGRPDDMKGQALVAFVTPRAGVRTEGSLREELRNHVAKEIGAIAKPDDIRFTEALPKTRSGKIMRRLLKEIATSGTVKGDTTTLEDFAVIAKLSGVDEE